MPAKKRRHERGAALCFFYEYLIVRAIIGGESFKFKEPFKDKAIDFKIKKRKIAGAMQGVGSCLYL